MIGPDLVAWCEANVAANPRSSIAGWRPTTLHRGQSGTIAAAISGWAIARTCGTSAMLRDTNSMRFVDPRAASARGGGRSRGGQGEGGAGSRQDASAPDRRGRRRGEGPGPCTRDAAETRGREVAGHRRSRRPGADPDLVGTGSQLTSAPDAARLRATGSPTRGLHSSERFGFEAAVAMVGTGRTAVAIHGRRSRRR